MTGPQIVTVPILLLITSELLRSQQNFLDQRRVDDVSFKLIYGNKLSFKLQNAKMMKKQFHNFDKIFFDVAKYQQCHLNVGI